MKKKKRGGVSKDDEGKIKSSAERDTPILSATVLKTGPGCGTSEHWQQGWCLNVC